jgi:type II secretory pathway pseudopilin PulG
LIELLVVIAIIVVLTALLAPAFTSLKSAGDITSGAYTIKGVLDQARTYAMANNTYTWVGFAGSIGTTVTGNVSTAVIASNDGTAYVCSATQLRTSDTTANTAIVIGTGTGTAAQIGKLIQLQNAHIGDTGAPTNDGTEFESRPNVASPFRMASAGMTPHPFTVQGTTFNEWIQFSPRGEALVNGGSTNITRYIEVGIIPTHGAAASSPTPKNIVAIEIGGLEGGAKIYRR